MNTVSKCLSTYSNGDLALLVQKKIKVIMTIHNVRRLIFRLLILVTIYWRKICNCTNNNLYSIRNLA